MRSDLYVIFVNYNNENHENWKETLKYAKHNRQTCAHSSLFKIDVNRQVFVISTTTTESLLYYLLMNKNVRWWTCNMQKPTICLKVSIMSMNEWNWRWRERSLRRIIWGLLKNCTSLHDEKHQHQTKLYGNRKNVCRFFFEKLCASRLKKLFNYVVPMNGEFFVLTFFMLPARIFNYQITKYFLLFFNT